MKTYGGVEVQLHTLLTLGLDEGEWSASCPGHLSLKKEPLVPIGGRAPVLARTQW